MEHGSVDNNVDSAQDYLLSVLAPFILQCKPEQIWHRREHCRAVL